MSSSLSTARGPGSVQGAKASAWLHQGVTMGEFQTPEPFLGALSEVPVELEPQFEISPSPPAGRLQDQKLVSGSAAMQQF